MLHIKKVLGAKPKEHTLATLTPMLTPWGEALDRDRVLPEHPNPQFARKNWDSLNGVWECAFVKLGQNGTDDPVRAVANANVPDAKSFGQKIVVPFSPEAALSGVGRQLTPDELLWYRRTVHVSQPLLDARVILHFGAVDHTCAVRVNGHLVGSHSGGYTPFFFDITDHLSKGDNELCVCVYDACEHSGGVRGKQRLDRGDIWYSSQSGIWQSVWLETVPSSHIESASLEPDAQQGVLRVTARLCESGSPAAGLPQTEQTRSHNATSSSQSVEADARDHAQSSPMPLLVEVLDSDGNVVARGQAQVTDGVARAELNLGTVRLWCPDDPYLYDVRLAYGSDEVLSYCGFRTVEVKRAADGHVRLHLNGSPFFVKGVLDQAYWPDGLMTAPSDDALVADIEAARDAGFNLMRKHIKVETARWYYHCDRLGMLVLQDMVSGGAAQANVWLTSYKPTLFKFSWNKYRDNTAKHMQKLGAGDPKYREEWTRICKETVSVLGGHPCIVGWSLFNEGWGQFESRAACDLVRSLDPTRPIDAVSGWYDQGCGDFKSVHNYFRDLAVWPDRRHGRAFVISEFGGLTHRVEGHSSLDEAYGYETYEDLDAWRDAVRTLLDQVEALEPRGLAGYVFTQLSDIEEETNGILTYDRRVNKLNG